MVCSIPGREAGEIKLRALGRLKTISLVLSVFINVYDFIMVLAISLLKVPAAQFLRHQYDRAVS